MKKQGSSSLNSTGEDAKFAKLSQKEQGKAIGGNPDETDAKYIQLWIEMFERDYPGLIKTMRRDVEVELRLSDTNKFAELSNDAERRKAFWLPEQLSQLLEKAYPSFWTNKKHAEWFMRKFPVFSFEDAARRVYSK